MSIMVGIIIGMSCVFLVISTLTYCILRDFRNRDYS